ncbi:hypothetical protein L486_00307 [Kwoniella mangroviensis CBS 10435]|uniref:Uncharacterized protein n=1 Tax=Kwoniella mangroviensis CBS 10435 TaxID=1331196 RepID=A0A1B9IYR1_9TREE|nr:uncharacterized protein I203_06373 [Kwoniella mangroviensis CBS 8507]OCF60671.1 hypothetical protein L486_00307 [Kwoniella mangroviensis CBS 10435]OCF64638.1 hypothetical protein I203_06373 [Kwoniella mangroviensis CBS 8507]OCF74580.1 hypothetical protein I204_04959 [Kwoniella mangroviensis CBS 8886]
MRFSLTISTLVLSLGAVSAQLTVTEPRADHWWVAQSLNTLAWEGSSPDQFSVFLSNTDTNVLTSILALTSVTYAYDRSKTINPGGVTPSGGYTILLTNPLNSSDVYAKSETFEIKAVGSTYPPQGSSAGSSASASGSGTASGSAASSAASASASSTGSNSAGTKLDVGKGLMGIISLVGGAMALF